MSKKPIYLLHPYLTKISFYKSWHEFKYHNHFHRAVFLLYSFSILALVFGTTNKVKWEIGSVASGGTGSVEFKVKVE